MSELQDWECPECKWPERCEGNPFGMHRPRCPWEWCSNYRLLMQIQTGSFNTIKGVTG